MSKKIKRNIYTSLENFKSKNNKVHDYNKLDDDLVEWVNERSVNLLVNRNTRIDKKYVSDVHEQVYFRISGHSYFLDYYLPKYRLAIEIDGGYHRIRREEDKERDKLFNLIGIRTIRINSKDVLKGEFLNVLRQKLKPKKPKENTKQRR